MSVSDLRIGFLHVWPIKTKSCECSVCTWKIVLFWRDIWGNISKTPVIFLYLYQRSTLDDNRIRAAALIFRYLLRCQHHFAVAGLRKRFNRDMLLYNNAHLLHRKVQYSWRLDGEKIQFSVCICHIVFERTVSCDQNILMSFISQSTDGMKLMLIHIFIGVWKASITVTIVQTIEG